MKREYIAEFKGGETYKKKVLREEYFLFVGGRSCRNSVDAGSADHVIQENSISGYTVSISDDIIEFPLFVRWNGFIRNRF